MRLFIQLNADGTPKAWPLIGDNVKYLAPAGTGFPAEAEAYETVDLTEFGFETFVGVAQPAFDALTQRVHEVPPVKVDGQWVRQWEVLALSPGEVASALSTATRALALRIDAEADAIRNAVLGGRTTEYQAAEADALAFKAAGYAGPVPPGVKSWLDAKTAVGAGWTAQQCADDILATAASWRSAEAAIRSNRLLRKLQAEAATTQAGIDAADAAWGVFTAAVKVRLGVPG